MVSNGAQLIIKEMKDKGFSLYELDKHVIIQINDTHPTMVIPELIRILTQEEGFTMEDAVSVVSRSVAYTNHTILAEALEKWPLDYLEQVVPKLVPIIKELNNRIAKTNKDKAIQIIDEDKRVHMAHIDIHYGVSVNGVAAIHTDILKNTELNSFYKLYPEKFNNKTNGITFRRWLLSCNHHLAELLDETIGTGYRKDAMELEKLLKFKDDEKVLDKLSQIKKNNKAVLIDHIRKAEGVELNPDSIFDIQVKRIHAYKRQLLFALKVLDLYNRLIENPNLDIRPYTFIFAGKAAQGYAFAKDVIHLINSIALMVNNDSRVNRKIKVVFIETFCTSNAQLIYPAADISEQISTAGKEASGTGNMKFMMNGAITLGTLDGANVEIKEHVGDENIIIFGLKAEDCSYYYAHGGYDPRSLSSSEPRINKMMTQLIDGTLKDPKGDSIYFWSIYDALVEHGDQYFVLKDFMPYVNAWEELDKIYCDKERWGRMSLLNIARSAYFSSDRTILEYADEIWHTPHN